MPTIELLAEIEVLRRHRAEAEDQIAELQLIIEEQKAEIASQPDLFAQNALLRYEITALKNDAQELAEWCTINAPQYLRGAARRILEATKGE